MKKRAGRSGRASENIDLLHQRRLAGSRRAGDDIERKLGHAAAQDRIESRDARRQAADGNFVGHVRLLGGVGSEVVGPCLAQKAGRQALPDERGQQITGRREHGDGSLDGRGRRLLLQRLLQECERLVPVIGADRPRVLERSVRQVQAASEDRGDSTSPTSGVNCRAKCSHRRRPAAATAGAFAPGPASRVSIRRNTRCRMLLLVMG